MEKKNVYGVIVLALFLALVWVTIQAGRPNVGLGVIGYAPLILSLLILFITFLVLWLMAKRSPVPGTSTTNWSIWVIICLIILGAAWFLYNLISSPVGK